MPLVFGAPCPAAHGLTGCSAGGTLLWRKDVSSSETISSLTVDPLDRRTLCLCGSQGLLAVLTVGSCQAAAAGVA
jgi:hypothetical protein